ncbi:MAG: 50S ribosomal protein L3 N(5)-glutamine methyltransferase [Rhodocyclaceae bacterium]|nr:50S ribosomal protein L3 N(5)-glutamine methyltransferase [Rhodocyclaceae bacterium]
MSNPFHNAQIAPPELLTVRDWLRYAMSRFGHAGLAHGQGFLDPFDEAVYLICHTLALPSERLEAFLGAALTADEARSLAWVIEQRTEQRMPSAYITGKAWLGDFGFRVDRRVLIPRSFIAELLRDDEVQPAPWLAEPDSVDSVLDLCTGSACLAVVAAHVYLNAHVDAADISADALEVAALNIADYGLEPRIELLHGDLFAPLAGRRYDRILCNPPYVDALAMGELPEEFRHEPALALAAGDDGMDAVRRILREAPEHLEPGGWLLVEVGERREIVEALWPDLDLIWPLTSAGDGVVFAVSAQTLAAARAAGQV